MERNDHNDLHDKIHPFINYATRSNGGQHVWAERKKAKQRIKQIPNALFNPYQSTCARKIIAKRISHISQASQKINYHYNPNRHPDSNYPGGQK